MRSQLAQWALVFCIIPLPSVIAFNYIDHNQYCVSACATAVGKVTFESDTKTNDCSGLYVDSLFDCAAVYCTQPEIQPGLNEENKTCISSGTPMPSYEVQMATVTTDDLRNLTRFTSKSVKKVNYTLAVVPDQSYFDLSFETTLAKYLASRLNWAFTWSLYGFWALVIMGGIIYRVFALARQAYWSNPSLPAGEKGVGSCTSRGRIPRSRTWFWRHILLPELLGEKQTQLFPGTVFPTRLETLIITLYIILNFVFCFPGYHVFAGNLSVSKPKIQLARYVANRAGFLTMGNMPVIWLFAARNNPLLWLTGWPYATYSQFHRWAARLATVEALVHAICYSIAYYWQNKYDKSWSERYWWCGVIAVISFTALTLFSMQVLRNRWYDLFLMIHIALAVLALAATLYHLFHMEDESFYAFIWACVAAWAFDRALRLSRILYHSLAPNMRGNKATASREPGTDMVRLEVTDFLGSTPPPGSYYYVYEPGQWRGYESHPFTICSWREEAPTSPGSSITDPTTTSDVGSEKETRVSIGATRKSSGSQGKLRHSFLIRSRDGFTKRLLNSIAPPSEAGQPHTLRVLLEGPYGETLPLDKHTDVLMIVGGSGVTAAVSHAYRLMQTPNTRLKLVWVVRETSLVENVCKHELAGLIPSEKATLEVYITQTGEAEKGTLLPFDGRSGRPDIEALVAAERSVCAQSLAVFTCGPASMSRSCRAAVAKVIGEPGGRIEFYEERFGW